MYICINIKTHTMKNDKHIINETNWVRVIILLTLVVSITILIRWRLDEQEYIDRRDKEMKYLRELERMETTPTMDGSSMMDSLENLGMLYPEIEQ